MWPDRYWVSSSISQLGIREHHSTRDRKIVPRTSLNDPDYGVSGLYLHFSRGQPCMTVVSRIYANERKLHSFHHHASQHAQLHKANWTPFTSGVSKEPPLCASPKRVTTDPPASEGLRQRTPHDVGRFPASWSAMMHVAGDCPALDLLGL
ncbi:hypothetical protein GE21DRAFT_1287193 [Neurospora crassa]|nr:hypothetical protein GE21DRAFT_1287193 [Neurospora crassa]